LIILTTLDIEIPSLVKKIGLIEMFGSIVFNEPLKNGSFDVR